MRCLHSFFSDVEEYAEFMKPIFSRGPSLQLRLIFSGYGGHRRSLLPTVVWGLSARIRTYMDTAVSPFYFLANGPRQILDSVSANIGFPPAARTGKQGLTPGTDCSKTANC